MMRTKIYQPITHHIQRLRHRLSPIGGLQSKNYAVCWNEPLSRRQERCLSSQCTSSTNTSADGFIGLGIQQNIVDKIMDMGITEPTPIQKAAISILLSGKNAAIESYTGSGKTLAYLIPLLSDFEQSASTPGKVRAIIVAPSQELAMQICRVAQDLVSTKGAVQQAIGGANKKRQISAIKSNKPIIIVGTPGRLAELSREGLLQTHFTEKIVLDEADKLLNKTYEADMDRLLSHVGQKVDNAQRVLVSATLSKQVLANFASRGWIEEYESISVGTMNQVNHNQEEEGLDVPQLSPNIDHGFVVASQMHKVDTARKCINALESEKVIIFHNYSKQLVQTAGRLETGGFRVGILESQMSKDEKKAVITSFNNGKIRVLVAAEAATRGLDFPGCDMVINLEMPMDVHHYVHRAGRTGRGANVGSVLTISAGKEAFIINKFSKQLKLKIPEYHVSHGRLEQVFSRKSSN